MNVIHEIKLHLTDKLNIRYIELFTMEMDTWTPGVEGIEAVMSTKSFLMQIANLAISVRKASYCVSYFLNA